MTVRAEAPEPEPEPSELDLALRIIVDDLGLIGDPAVPRGARQLRPYEDPLVKLGQILFFSQSLAGGFDSSCATCHLPDFGGSDGLSLSVGVVPLDRSVVGPSRRVDIDRDRDPLADGGPNMHRNSISTFNASLMDRALMSDGRVHVIDTDVVPGGMGQRIVTPETDPGYDMSGVSGLIETVAKFPITNDNEMRGFYYADISNPDDFRRHLVERLKGNVDAHYMSRDAASNWLELFRKGFGQADAEKDEVITLQNIQRALGKYISSQIFVDTPWRDYLEGDLDAISDEAKQGALLFFKPLQEGGLGCVACHEGDRFTNEGFYNVGFPQIGRGFQRSDRFDLGRWTVTRDENDRYAHRVPSLLNVDLTAPYGHAGTFPNLESLLRYHVNPRGAVVAFDFTLQHLPQFINSGIFYDDAEYRTMSAIGYTSFDAAEQMLPARPINGLEENHLLAFLRSLTDRCAADVTCRRDWVPLPAEDPDGHLLGADNGPAPAFLDPDVITPADYPSVLPVTNTELEELDTFADVSQCENGLSSAANQNLSRFVRKDLSLGLTAAHGFNADTWRYDGRWINIETTMQSGGVTSVYLDDDCWPDLIYPTGDEGGLLAYLNQGHQNPFIADRSVFGGNDAARSYARITAVGVADLDGDYRRELFLGNLHPGTLKVLSPNTSGIYEVVSQLPMSRSSFGMSFGDIDMDGYLDMFVTHWDSDGVDGTAPALWRNDSGQAWLPWDVQGRTSPQHLDQKWNWTAKFADFRNARRQDLVVSSDFGSSAALRNDGGVYQNVTNREVVSDQNGMGGAVGDIDNDGYLDWFVTSILDPDGEADANWGITGNRLYRNTSSPIALRFEDATEEAGVRDGNWGWGACMADFNNDGFLDIFHVNGFGKIPESLRADDMGAWIDLYAEVAHEFIDTTPKLFVNDGSGSFVEQSSAWGIDSPSEGRGVTCFDYDRDGDIDIALLDHSTGIQFYENQTGNGDASRFLNVRLVGESPNTDAIGARVYVTANTGESFGWQRMMRISEANSNFNSQNIPDIHFGLGSAEVISTLRIEWPDSTGLVCVGLATNQFMAFDQRDKLWPKLLNPEAPDCIWYPDMSQVAFDLLEPTGG